MSPNQARVTRHYFLINYYYIYSVELIRCIFIKMFSQLNNKFRCEVSCSVSVCSVLIASQQTEAQ